MRIILALVIVLIVALSSVTNYAAEKPVTTILPRYVPIERPVIGGASPVELPIKDTALITGDELFYGSFITESKKQERPHARR